MVRTRDFVLFLLTVGFLVLAITVTNKLHNRPGNLVNDWWNALVTDTDYSAEVPAITDDREGRLANLKTKVLARLATDQPVVETVPTVATTTTSDDVATSTDEVASEPVVAKCSSYQTNPVSWQPQLIEQENREGVRVYYEPGVFDPLSSTTAESIKAIIPLRSWPAAKSSCLPSDVIGIALDGSLMRNAELAVYTVFGADTLIGYSLDGFPIYGQSATKTDTCGGVMVSGNYRYFLSLDRPGLINCFSNQPINLN